MSMELGPYTNFHELNQDWFLNEFNKVLAEWADMKKSFNSLNEAFNDLRNYVNDYFKNLDVQEEINNKLDAMSADGSLSAIINQEIFGDINNKISALNYDYIVIISDSYGEGYTPDGNVTSFATYIQQLTGKTVKNYSIGGYGFTTGTASFYQLLQNAISEMTDEEKARTGLVLFCGGYNDKGSINNIDANIKLCVDLAKQNFHNSVVGIIPFCWITEGLTTGIHASATYAELIPVYESYYKGALTNGCLTLKDSCALLRNSTFFSSDYVHPNSNGQYQIALNLSNWILGSDIDCRTYQNKVPFAGVNGNGVTLQGQYTVSGETTEIIISTLKAVYSNPISIKCNNTNVYLCDLQSPGVFAHNGVTLPCVANIKNNNLFYAVSGVILIKDSKVYISFLHMTDEHTNFLNLNSVQEINVYHMCCTNVDTLYQ